VIPKNTILDVKNGKTSNMKKPVFSKNEQMDVPKLYSFKQLYNISTLINDKSTQQDDINSI